MIPLDLSAQIPLGVTAVELIAYVEPPSGTVGIRADAWERVIMTHESTILIEVPPSRVFYVMPGESTTKYRFEVLRRFR